MEQITSILENLVGNIKFANPWAFVLLSLPIVFLLLYSWDFARHYPELRLSSIKGIPATFMNRLRGNAKHFLLLLRILSYCLLIIAIARPQSFLNKDLLSTEGIDIVLATDVSGSMLLEDFEPNRLEASKKVAQDFVELRPDDRIGLVVFAGQSFTLCPITSDHKILKTQIESVQHGLLIDQTAIGEGLERAVRRLSNREEEDQAKSRVVILLTDGQSNYGEVPPETATDMAVDENIRVYTIGVGNDLDFELLEYIAEATGGEFYQAKNKKSLKRIYEEIDVLEKSRVNETVIQRVTEEYMPFLFWAGVLFLLEILLRYTILKSLP